MVRSPRPLDTLIAVAAIAAPASIAAAEQRPILVDGLFDDWVGAAPAWTDPEGDAPGGFLDIGRLWIADDDGAFYVRFELDTVFDLAEDRDLRLYLDTDMDAGTGLSINGIGAELEWRFGSRQGTFFSGGGSDTVFHEDLALVGLPTTTASQFEVVISRTAQPDGSTFLFDGPLVRVVLAEPGGDMAPNNGSTLTYAMDVGTAPLPETLPLAKIIPADVRFATWNVLSDGIFDNGLQDGFERLLVATAPDIVCFQEIYSHSANQTRDLVASWLGGAWYAASNNDCKVVSRYPVLGAWSIDGNVAVHLDVSGTPIGDDLLVINAHLPCCSNDSGRQDEIDAILAFIRESREPGGVLTLPDATPLVIAGDLNLVGDSLQLSSLVNGNIIDNGTYGPDFIPDYDVTPFADRIDRQTERRLAYTWRSDTSSFWPGRLDFVIHTDSVLAARHGYVLYTPAMSLGPLVDNGLQVGDSLVSDHLLRIVDFAPPEDDPVPGDVNGDGIVDVADLVAVIIDWGPCVGCDADLNGDGVVDVSDLVEVILNWS